MQHTINYKDLIAILNDAIDYLKILVKNENLKEHHRYYYDNIEYLKDLKYKLYESKAKWFKITDDNPF